MKIFLIILLLLFNPINAREVGQTEITTEEGIEVYQKDKYYLLKKNVIIESDNFNLRAQNVKAFFDKDLYDITDIHSKGNVNFETIQGLQARGNAINFKVKDEDIFVQGVNSYLKTMEVEMRSDNTIKVNNTSGEFELIGNNSQITTKTTFISGNSIIGNFIDVDGEKVVEKMNVEDNTQINIKTETLNMFALKAKFDKQIDTIELFDNVKILRNEEIITGDYAKINTVDESYKITSKKTKKVKVLLSNND